MRLSLTSILTVASLTVASVALEMSDWGRLGKARARHAAQSPMYWRSRR